MESWDIAWQLGNRHLIISLARAFSSTRTPIRQRTTVSRSGWRPCSTGEDPLVAAAYDFCMFKRGSLMSGAAGGGLMAEILTACPEARTACYLTGPPWQPRPVLIDRAGVRDRCTVEHGDFFNALPKGYDLYVIKRIPHDWPDDHCVTILRNCAESMN